MKSSRRFFILSCLFLAFAIGVQHTNAQEIIAGWVDRSDELPGMVSDREIIILASAAGVAITALIVVLVVNKKQSSLSSTERGISNHPDVGLALERNPKSMLEEIQDVAYESPVQVFTACENLTTNYSDTKLYKVGLRFRF